MSKTTAIPADVVARFHGKYQVVESGCWEWQASRLSNGYGQFHAQPFTTLAHRFSYMAHVGSIPDGLVIDHLCRNRACVNPAHLEAVTQSTNLARGETSNAAYSARTHCGRGHEFTPENTRMTSRGRRCRKCAVIRTLKSRHRRT